MEGSGVGIAGCVVHGDVHGDVVLQKSIAIGCTVTLNAYSGCL